MARDQDLPANPMRISGACGRLMCCLKYEHPLYQDFKATAPAIGEQVESPAGPGVVVGHSVPGDSVVIKLAADGSEAGLPEGVGVLRSGRLRLATLTAPRLRNRSSPAAADEAVCTESHRQPAGARTAIGQ